MSMTMSTTAGCAFPSRDPPFVMNDGLSAGVRRDVVGAAESQADNASDAAIVVRAIEQARGFMSSPGKGRSLRLLLVPPAVKRAALLHDLDVALTFEVFLGHALPLEIRQRWE
jgi:hypothetical protein